jgi:hypothetical protein
MFTPQPSYNIETCDVSSRLAFACDTASAGTSPRTPSYSKRDISKLTSQIVSIPPLSLCSRICLIPSRRLSNRFVSRRKQHNHKERHDKAAGTGDAPATKDDAQVGRVPCEEHLSILVSALVLWIPCEGDVVVLEVAYVHVALGSAVIHTRHVVAHVAVIHV